MYTFLGGLMKSATKDCYLHLLSKVEMKGRRLVEEHYSADYIAVQVLPPQDARLGLAQVSLSRFEGFRN